MSEEEIVAVLMLEEIFNLEDSDIRSRIQSAKYRSQFTHTRDQPLEATAFWNGVLRNPPTRKDKPPITVCERLKRNIAPIVDLRSYFICVFLVETLGRIFGIIKRSILAAF